MTDTLSEESGEQILLGRDDSLVRAVGRSLIEHGLGDGTSLFEPVRKAWSPETADELYRLYNEHPDPGTDSFLVKLQRQLQGASDEAILLAAEMLTLHALPLGNFGPTKKHARISQVISWMREPATIPPRVDAAFAQHSWNGGVGAHTMIWKWLQDVVAFTRAWWQMPEAQRSQALNDPWAWEGVVHQFPAIASLREELLYLAFPGYFLPIVNVQHKAAIRDAFGHMIKERTDNLDHDLYLITLALQRQTGVPAEYYSAPFAHEWQAKPESTAEQRAWLVRPRPGGQDLVETWKREGFVSLAGTHLSDVAPGTELAQVREAVEAGYQHLDYAQRIALAREYYTFLSRMAEGHIVTTVIGNSLSAGVITGEAVYDPGATDTRLRRPVTWQDTEPVAVDELPAPLPAELDQQGTVVDLTRGIDVLSQMLGAEHPESLSTASVAEAAAAISTVPVLAVATPALAERVHMPLAWLREVIDVLQERQQIVFYGPPGTGKTFLAQEIARHVAERDAVRLVQFHPSYAYEDFFEGFRPVSEQDGSVGFTLTAGPLRSLASDAASNPGEPYVLIVDEVNRANLAKVFGELYFLLEYRDAKIGLQYSPDKSFSLPRNVFFIGTMNTADRSIALVDAAIRRRFAFIELHPDEPPVRDLLANWLAASHKVADERAGLLRALNQAIGEEDRDFKIGPSYLMRPAAESPPGLERVWQYDLLPLLEEHYYGRLTRSQVHARFGLAATRARLAQAEPSATVEPSSPEIAGP
jgi:5-methylcytosine-specific restriction protein B